LRPLHLRPDFGEFFFELHDALFGGQGLIIRLGIGEEKRGRRQKAPDNSPDNSLDLVTGDLRIRAANLLPQFVIVVAADIVGITAAAAGSRAHAPRAVFAAQECAEQMLGRGTPVCPELLLVEHLLRALKNGTLDEDGAGDFDALAALPMFA